MCLAIPGQVMSVEDIGLNRVAKVQFGGVERPVIMDFVPDAAPGEFVLVHVGFALSRIDEAEAQATLELIERLGMMEPLDEVET
jgi:hydrogenase expression/formation protein HypC